MNNLEQLDFLFEDYVPPEKQKAEENAVQTEKPDEPKKSPEETDEAKAWAAHAKKEREKAFSRIKEMSELIFTSKGNLKLIDYLVIQSNFNDYTVRNCLLIADQRPSATLLKSFDAWKATDDNIFIKKGSVGITVIEPGKEFVRRDGTAGRYYNTRTLFDVEQVQGYDKDERKSDIGFDTKLSALFHVVIALRIKIYSHNDPTRAVLYSPSEYRMYINKAADSKIVYYQLLIELAHSVLSSKDDYSRARYGFICQMVGFMLCRMTDESDLANNIADSFDVPQEYSQLKKNDVIPILESVKRTANTIMLEYRKQLKKLNQRDDGNA